MKNINQNKGILEWKLSIDQSDFFFKGIDKGRFIHVSYKDFIDSPSQIIRDIFDFLELDYTEDLINIVQKNIKRNNPEIKESTDKNIYSIGGDILNQTINNNYTPS